MRRTPLLLEVEFQRSVQVHLGQLMLTPSTCMSSRGGISRLRFYPAKLGDQVLAQFKVFNDVAIEWLSRPQVQDDGLRLHGEPERSHRFDDLRQGEARLTRNRSIAHSEW